MRPAGGASCRFRVWTACEGTRGSSTAAELPLVPSHAVHTRNRHDAPPAGRINLYSQMGRPDSSVGPDCVPPVRPDRRVGPTRGCDMVKFERYSFTFVSRY